MYSPSQFSDCCSLKQWSTGSEALGRAMPGAVRVTVHSAPSLTVPAHTLLADLSPEPGPSKLSLEMSLWLCRGETGSNQVLLSDSDSDSSKLITESPSYQGVDVCGPTVCWSLQFLVINFKTTAYMCLRSFL